MKNNGIVTSNLFEQYTDAELTDRIKKGEVKLYEILIRRCNTALYKIGRAYRYNHDDTQDLMQEAYILAFYDLEKFENRSSFKTWITRIMLNQCYHKKKKFSFQYEVAADHLQAEKDIPMFQQPISTDKIAINKELGRVLESALDKLPEDYRIVFTLRELNGLSISETREVLQITESNVKVRLNRAKKMLRSEIEKMYSPQDIFEFNLVYCDRMVHRVMGKIETEQPL